MIKNTGKYILVDKEPKPVEDVLEWAKWFEKADRVVKQTNIGEVLISTVFLGLDYSTFFRKAPRVFETMIFGGEYDQYQERYSTWEQAEEGHKKAIDLVINS